MSVNFLSEIIARKREEVSELKSQTDATSLPEQALKIRGDTPRHRFRTTLQATDAPIINVIAEFKRRSPSRGVIREDLSPRDAVRHYEHGGACAISVLTDAQFGGSIDDLIAVRTETRLPILRKDFAIDPIQVYEAARAGADAILLICAVLDDSRLAELREIAEEELGLDALIEVHTSEELHRALKIGANVIGVNNRDLRTFEVSTKTSEQIIAEAPPRVTMISESGLGSANQLRHLQALGYRGFLIGEMLMRADDPAAALRQLIASP
jgi:indole-3-glycerol phosphate synthase